MGKRTVEYKFISFDTDKELSDEVSKLLEQREGIKGGSVYWEVYGNPVMVFNGDAVLIGQALIKVLEMHPPLYPR